MSLLIGYQVGLINRTFWRIYVRFGMMEMRGFVQVWAGRFWGRLVFVEKAWALRKGEQSGGETKVGAKAKAGKVKRKLDSPSVYRDQHRVF